MKPTPTQRLVTHPAWIDFVIWCDARRLFVYKGCADLFRPEIRDYFINFPHMIERTDPLPLIVRHSHVNWDGGFEGMMAINPLTASLVLSTEFKTWAEDLNNWSLDSEILNDFPALMGKAWIHNKGHQGHIEYQDDIRWFRELVNESGEIETIVTPDTPDN
jgi:hypothetical protein